MNNSIIQGDCLDILPTLPTESVGLVVTDPPYLVRYRDRSGRTVRNDDNPGVLAAFTDIYRLLKPDSLCISFYGWNSVDAFFAAWRGAGFRPVGHIVWPKDYASSRRYLQACHEQAYLLAKGTPRIPAEPVKDVQSWEYTGNRAHPTEKAVSVLKPLISCFSSPGDLVLDPFAGSGSACVAAALSGRRYLGIELEARYCEHARRRLAGVSRCLDRQTQAGGCHRRTV
ncbi:MAG: DNA methylase [Burkholderiales bacterium]|nr:DNA methylase [Burkholderiales bacterium]